MIRASIPVLALSVALSVHGAPPRKAAPSASQLQTQVRQLTKERDDLKARLAATESLQQDLAEATRSRDAARQESQGYRKELEQLRATFRENQSSGESMLTDLQKARTDATAAEEAKLALQKRVTDLEAKLKAGAEEGALLSVTDEVTPARPMNLNRVVPKVRRVDSGVVVVNVLVSENGEVLSSRLLQGLPGEGEGVQKANEACVEAAKRIVFDPARAADGKTRVRVWQGVGFYIP
ncbi:MAG: hypothetical protein LWX11_01465 [Firmicutes bacterium]|nr:hypothetical protein [Bacillota bacterium]